MKSNSGLVDKLNAIMTEVIRKHRILVEGLTEQQTADALRQAISCGDFTKLVTPDGSQSVIYIPFQREQELRIKIQELRNILARHGIEEIEIA